MELEIHELQSPQAQDALDKLVRGEDVLIIKPISLTNVEDEGLTLLVWSTWENEKLTRELATQEVVDGRKLFDEILESWSSLQKFVAGREVPCFLHYDYGGGSYRICELRLDGTINWNLPKFRSST
jgi:hypothetical protein